MTMPSDAEKEEPSIFDKFATRVGNFVAQAPFFSFCVGVVLLWLPTYFITRDLEKWQLPINTLTTIITFLMVAVLENVTKRSGDATQHKLNAIAQGLVVVLEDHDSEPEADELRKAVGLEDKESS